MKKNVIDGFACNIESKTVVADSITIQFIKSSRQSFFKDVKTRMDAYSERKEKKRFTW